MGSCYNYWTGCSDKCEYLLKNLHKKYISKPNIFEKSLYANKNISPLTLYKI